MFENIFELPADYAVEIHRAAQLTAFANEKYIWGQYQI